MWKRLNTLKILYNLHILKIFITFCIWKQVFPVILPWPSPYCCTSMCCTEPAWMKLNIYKICTEKYPVFESQSLWIQWTRCHPRYRASVCIPRYVFTIERWWGIRLIMTKRKIGNWHIYGQAYHSMIWKTFNISGKDWQLAAIPKSHLNKGGTK